MNYSSIGKDGSAREEALKRRSAAMRDTLRMSPKPNQTTEQSVEPKEDQKPSAKPFAPATR
jgi:hypothetical protein